MPAELPAIHGLEPAARHRPEGEHVSVGGDVCGKGPPPPSRSWCAAPASWSRSRPRAACWGVLRSPRFTDARLDPGPGDALVLSTDGVSEARRRCAELGPEGAPALAGAAGSSADAIAGRLAAAAPRFSDGRLHDDVAAVVVRCPTS